MLAALLLNLPEQRGRIASKPKRKRLDVIPMLFSADVELEIKAKHRPSIDDNTMIALALSVFLADE